MMNYSRWALFAAAVWSAWGGAETAAAAGAAADAAAVLKTAEDIRSLERAQIGVDLRTVAAGQKTVYDLKVLRSTERRAEIEFLGPPEEHGRRMLALGTQYWSTFPDSHKVVAVSRREMIGNSAFALADIFQLDAEHDYAARVTGAVKLGGLDALKLELKAKRDEAPYARIEYWVEAAGSFPLQAKFYGASGKLLKTMTVESRKEIAGRLRPEVTKMVDEVTTGHVSWWKTKSMVAASVPDTVFTKDFLAAGG